MDITSVHCYAMNATTLKERIPLREMIGSLLASSSLMSNKNPPRPQIQEFHNTKRPCLGYPATPCEHQISFKTTHQKLCD